MAEFRRVLEDFQLLDLGFEGPRFTWCNGRYGSPNFTRERLDRAMASESWSTLFDVVMFLFYPVIYQTIILCWCLFRDLLKFNGLKAGCSGMRLVGLNKRTHRR
jgi:hypothetical protein